MNAIEMNRLERNRKERCGEECEVLRSPEKRLEKEAQSPDMDRYLKQNCAARGKVKTHCPTFPTMTVSASTSVTLYLYTTAKLDHLLQEDLNLFPLSVIPCGNILIK
jgi:hypothetical protein